MPFGLDGSVKLAPVPDTYLICVIRLEYAESDLLKHSANGQPHVSTRVNQPRQAELSVHQPLSRPITLSALHSANPSCKASCKALHHRTQSILKCVCLQLLLYVVHADVYIISLVCSLWVNIDVGDMAEGIAIVGLVASIVTLVDLSAKVLSRQRDFSSNLSDVPQSFRSVWTQLPLLTATLEHIQSQAQTRQLPDDVIRALKAVVDSTSEQVSLVQTYLSQVLPCDDASKLERTLKALKSLAKEDKIQEALEKIHKSNDLLILHQTTRHVDTGDRILEELSKLSATPVAPSNSYGVCLGRAPQVAADAFIGRTSELQQLRDWLSSKSQPDGQRIISIAGMGGMGKTQLSLAHVRDCADHYSSVFWVNAKDETSLRQSMADLSAIVFPESANLVAASMDDEKVKVDKVRRWLSESQNDQWLLIFDNYDDPCLPGMDSSTGYDIRTYFPNRAQGSILITTRSQRLLFAKQLLLKKLEGIEQSLAVLAARSGRAVDGGKINANANKG